VADNTFFIERSCKLPESHIEKVEPPLDSKDYYLIFSHQFVTGHPQLANQIRDKIQRMRESGEYDKIAVQYLE